MRCLLRLLNQLLVPSALIGIFLFHFSSCAFLPLKQEINILNQAATIHGTISHDANNEKPIIILLYQVEPEQNTLVDYSIVHEYREFHFVAAPGQYILAAFEDRNEDLVYQEGEYAGYYGSPTTVTLDSGREINGLNITLQNPQTITLKESPNLSHPSIKAKQGLPNVPVSIGEIVEITDPQFTQEYGGMGLWEPIRFWETVGGGIFFLEPFSENKIPVLFVHGAGGHPQEWEPIIQRLDRSKFQPWVVFYPSGFRLTWLVDGIGNNLSEIYVRYKFEKLAVVAHSMGGLISRSLLNLVAESEYSEDFDLQLITISTPWGGHYAAKIGVDYAPAVIPSWEDMVPDSPFQQSLFQTPWPDSMKYYLLFSFKGGRNPFTNGNDDGTVSLISQLKPEAQKAAVKSFGFNEDHTSILKSSEVSETINLILSSY